MRQAVVFLICILTPRTHLIQAVAPVELRQRLGQLRAGSALLLQYPQRKVHAIAQRGNPFAYVMG
jgi:hypothetical protein